MREEGAGLAAVGEGGGVLPVWGEAVQEEGVRLSVCPSVCLSWGVPQPRSEPAGAGGAGSWQCHDVPGIRAAPRGWAQPGGAETTAPSPPRPCPAAPSWR